MPCVPSWCFCGSLTLIVIGNTSTVGSDKVDPLPFLESGGVIVVGGVTVSFDSKIGEEDGIIEGSGGVVV